ncbi:hypothetical protein [Parabacteroides sp. PF5-9]|uniref:hypothetical protein n=1 Tax=Parabacteroides sp. PF5-9 TaxID=1742404 RepID=UPI00247534C0|nr:hypothetical protein [Parabacteroides sp. PF5-9]MDH6357234.1 hypothetical protein [Parabacteroides sp. PF5-9]
MKQQDRDALKSWEEYKEDITNSTPVDTSMTAAEREKHRLWLEDNPEEWIIFFFPKYAKCAFAEFQKKAIKRLINNPEWYEVWSWSRELAKSTIAMFVIMYLVLTKRKKNILLISNTIENAVRLLTPYIANFEANGRIKAYYGEQQNIGFWTDQEFVTKGGAAFRALGAGQSPRGSRNEEIRPDVQYYDDFDTDKECQNPDIVDKKWDWSEKAVYPTRSISEPLLVLWCGNIIADNTCVGRAAKMADHHDIINLRMVDIRKPNPTEDYANGVSVWPQKNSEADIDRVLSKISMKAIMGEYFNNPISEGTVFKEVKYGKMPNLKRFPFLVIYGDPTQSEQKGTAKNKKGSRKAVWLVGCIGDVLYVFRGFIGKMSNYEFITCFFVLYEWVAGRCPVYLYMENNSLQDPFYQQVFKKHLAQIRKERKTNITVLPDEGKKPDKAVRIEADLEPLNREGRLVLNIAEKEDPNMVELDNEFKYFKLSLPYPADGLDCLQGGNKIIENKVAELAPVTVIKIESLRNNNRHRR